MASRYEKINRADFEKFLDRLLIRKTAGLYSNTAGNEVVFAIDTPRPHLWIYVYSSFRTGSTSARKKGQDAIRLVLGWKHPDLRRPIILAKTSHCKRITTWQRNVERKIAALRVLAEQIPLCQKCGRPMRLQKNKTTGNVFWSCSGYRLKTGDGHRRCTWTANIPKWDQNKFQEWGK